MNKSDQINELAAAKALFNAECPNIPRDATSDKGKNASLDNITKITRPLLAKHGLSFMQICEDMTGEISITQILIHSSGQFISGLLRIPSEPPRISKQGNKMMNDTQAIGSSITYARRYGMLSFLGLAQEDDPNDDDGHKADYDRNLYGQQVKKSHNQYAKSGHLPSKVNNSTFLHKIGSTKIGSTTLLHINTLITHHAIPDDVVSKWKEHFQIKRLEELTESQASRLIDKIAVKYYGRSDDDIIENNEV